MKKRMILLWALAACLILGGCSAIVVEDPQPVIIGLSNLVGLLT